MPWREYMMVLLLIVVAIIIGYFDGISNQIPLPGNAQKINPQMGSNKKIDSGPTPGRDQNNASENSATANQMEAAYLGDNACEEPEQVASQQHRIVSDNSIYYIASIAIVLGLGLAWYFRNMASDHGLYWVGVITLAALIFYTIYTRQLVIDTEDSAKEQAYLTRQSNCFIQLEQRPWLKVEIRPGPFRIAHNLINPDDGPAGSFYPGYTIVNIGHWPALNVRFNLQAYIGNEKRTNPEEQRKKECETFRHKPLRNEQTGRVLFPGETWSEKDDEIPYFAGFSKSDRRWMDLIGGKLKFQFYVVGCVDYVIGRGHHQTGFIYKVEKIIRKPNTANSFDIWLDATGDGIQGRDIRAIKGESTSLVD
ncbi:MAG TPA: hypothetical protein VIJ42_09355 [Stellaceae bacterium]